jgi:ketosteroid isomerase-like protein
MSFNDCITRRDIGGLSRLMSDDHVFIDSADNIVSGKTRCVEAWQGFFAAFPDYRNHFARVLLAGDKVVMIGHSVCSDTRLAGPALWTAKVEGDLVSEWRVYRTQALTGRASGSLIDRPISELASLARSAYG